jgi:adenine-specific DNA-methyltransferase
MTRNTRLELTWIGKENRHRLEPRILMEDQGLSYHAHAKRAGDLFDNLLIRGDNLLALRMLETLYSGAVKCVYIDPPFNTGEAFEHYDDGVEHSLWLSLMRDRLESLHRLLRPDGSLFIHIDHNELGYLIVLTDEIFGRHNRQYIVTFKQSSVSGPKSNNPGIVTTANYILVYSKDKNLWKPKKGAQAIERDSRYSKFVQNIGEKFEDWKLIGLKEAFCEISGRSFDEVKKEDPIAAEAELSQFVIDYAAQVVRTARVKDKDVNESARAALIASRRIANVVTRSERDEKDNYYFLNGEQLLFYSKKVREVDGKRTASTALSNIWDDLLSNNLHKEGGVDFPKGKKPEALLKRIIELVTDPGDLVLDSFAGSGTTGAVAHKLKRRWIMVELRQQAEKEIHRRMVSVVDGSDRDGITKAVNWAGGGGFRFCHLAPSLLEKDQWGQWVISKDYNPAMLAQAMCAHMGFTYQPDAQTYWNHGYSSESDFIYVTTAALTHEQLRAISDDVGKGRTLLVCCKAFQGVHVGALKNLTVQKIPTIILNRCEWGRDDYSLRVASLPDVPDPEPVADVVKTRGRAADPAQASLFDGGEG